MKGNQTLDKSRTCNSPVAAAAAAAACVQKQVVMGQELSRYFFGTAHPILMTRRFSGHIWGVRPRRNRFSIRIQIGQIKAICELEIELLIPQRLFKIHSTRAAHPPIYTLSSVNGRRGALNGKNPSCSWHSSPTYNSFNLLSAAREEGRKSMSFG